MIVSVSINSGALPPTLLLGEDSERGSDLSRAMASLESAHESARQSARQSGGQSAVLSSSKPDALGRMVAAGKIINEMSEE